MSRRLIPAEEVLREWRKDPKFVAAYDALEDEFAVASALIKARRRAISPAPPGTGARAAR